MKVSRRNETTGRVLCRAGWITCTMLCGWLTVAAGEALDVSRGYEAFQLIQSRNLFDPDRRASRVREEAPQVAAQVRVESLVLTGTMVYEGRAFAFFSGSTPEYRQVLGPGSAIAGFDLVAITTTRVELERDGEHVVLPIGGRLKREGEGNWIASAAADGPVAGQEPAASGQTVAGTTATSDMSDVMKRMMERRAQQVTP
jgi:hypothetical protein